MTLPTLDRLDAHLGQRASLHTRRMWRGHAERFLTTAGTKEAYTEADIRAYLDALVRHGYKESSITAILVAVKGFFRANGLAWPVDERQIHLGLPQDEPDAPALEPAEVIALIRGVRTVPGIPRLVMCLASVWGLRGDEIVRTLNAGCNGTVLEIATAKGGRRRTHKIPVALAPVLTFKPQEVSYHQLHTVFLHTMRAYCREPIKREGLHSLRRSVVTMLFEVGLTEDRIIRWLGWRMFRQQSIAQRYNKVKPIALDDEVYGLHTFLYVWQKG